MMVTLLNLKYKGKVQNFSIVQITNIYLLYLLDNKYHATFPKAGIKIIIYTPRL